MNKHLENVLNAIACKLLPTSDLLESKAELEEYIAWAKSGEIECEEGDIADSERQLARANKVLAMRESRASK
jgi:ribosomal protein L29